MELVKRHIVGNDILRVLRIRPFFLMILSEFFSQLAFNMQHFVLIFIIYGLTHSNTAVSGMILSFMIPAVLFSVITGVYVDRWNKKKVLLYTHLIRATLLLPFLIPNLHLGFIYILTFLIAVATQFFVPAESAVIPMLIPRKLIVSANAVFAFSIYGGTLIGYVLSGPVLLWFGRTNAIALLISLFFVGALFVSGIKINNRKKELIKENLNPSRSYSVTREAREIFSFIRRAKKVMPSQVKLLLMHSYTI
ncbi:MFS transporter [Candidatus Roizmanbacteria bacterium]|nr:MFS transporter [Candidatus Roizmanbacteria bacterium]